jgi:AcrR family transcriptional regulator
MNESDDDRAGLTPCSMPRGRNAAATKQAILDAARRCFAHEGYEQVGVREIAARAGIDPALVNRYFGSKEGLFAEAVSRKFDLSELCEGERSTLGVRLVRVVLKKKPPGDDHDPLIALLRSSSSDVAGHMLREALLEGFVSPLAARLEGPNARQRAELVGCTLLGLLVYRTVVGGTAMQDVEQQVALVGPTLQGLIDGECAPSCALAADERDD